MDEARKLREATADLLDDATDALLKVNTLSALLDERTADADRLLALRSDPDTEVVHDHLAHATRNLTLLLARLDDTLPTPGPAAREQAWRGDAA